MLRHDISCYDMIEHDMISWYGIKIWYQNMISKYDIKIWYQPMMSSYDIKTWYQNMISKIWSQHVITTYYFEFDTKMWYQNMENNLILKMISDVDI